MKKSRFYEMKRMLDLYASSGDDKWEVFGLLDSSISLGTYNRLIESFYDNSMYEMALFMVLRGRWTDRTLGEIVDSVVMQQLLAKWDENTLHAVIKTILKRIHEQMQLQTSKEEDDT